MGARELMIDAAERLAGEQGFAAMTLREVQAAAGQRNKSAAQYHFGSREGLIDAVVTARMGPINARRLDLLDALGEDASLRELVEVLVVPLAEAVVGRPSWWARFLFRGLADPAVGQAVGRSFQGASYRKVRRRLAAALTHLPSPIIDFRIDQTVSLAVMWLASLEAGATRRLADVQVANLVDACVAVLDAAPSDATLTALSHTRSA